ncbi:MAG TPA: AAA family ATPase [Longimicrobiales bacterium]
MKLRRLTLQGFKSFADKTDLKFHEGITAIVGPNGCGKSNISDAIRWVLGEQRPTAIRGSKMEEAIFQGTTQRRPVNRAEVSLAFDNEERRLPIEGDEVEIRRVVFREGGSDYQVNRSSVRLRDVLDMCRDTGLGANAYTVIEQGMVDAILSDRPEERRHMFEEAAGVGRYKDRRKVAQRRLEAAETDLSRLNDLISEVEAKVRSLGRQRKRAQKYGEFRARKLSLEVAIAQYELSDIRARLEKAEAMLEAIGRNEPAARASLSESEARLEKLRLESGEALRERSGVSMRLEDISRQIGEHERAIAVADERRAHAVRRLEQIAVEREELRARVAALETELHELDTEHHGQYGIVESLAERVAEVQERQGALRQEVTDIRRMDEEARSRENEITRQLARLEGDAVNAETRAREAESRLEHLAVEREELEAELLRLDEQRDLFAEQARDLAARLDTLRTEADAAQRRLQAMREAELEARRGYAAAEDRASHLASRVAALEALEREYHGFAPAVAHALTHKQNFRGLLGPVAEYLRLPRDRAAAVEGTLGSLLQAIVVQDFENIDQLAQWLDSEESQEQSQVKGALALIPQEALPRLEALLETIRFVGKPPEDTVLLGRREKLAQLRDESEAATQDRDHKAAEKDAAAESISQIEADLRGLQSVGQQVELDLRRADADEANRVGQRGRTERAREELERRRADLLATIEKAQTDAAAAREARLQLESVLSRHRAEWQLSTETLTEREAAWEQVRDEEAELRVAHARAEGALAALDRRIQNSRTEHEQIGIRLGALDREEAEHHRSLDELEHTRTNSGAALETLFRDRDTLAVEVRQIDERVAIATEKAEALENKVRELRRQTEDQSESRHRLELQKAEADAAERRVRERLEAEWARPFEQLVASAPSLEETELRRRKALELDEDSETGAGDVEVAGAGGSGGAGDGEAWDEGAGGRGPATFEVLDTHEPAPVEPPAAETATATTPAARYRAWKAELTMLSTDIERLGPINMLAVEEYDEESQRLKFLQSQRDDLTSARDDLQHAIKEINKTATDLFVDTFDKVKVNFQTTFQTLFEGGECDIRLEEPTDPLESPIDIIASPRGKRTQRIHLLSGGERALTALALLFAIYLVKPSPFCVLDEVDAPLDEANIGRFIAMLKEFKVNTQFIVITHNPRTMEAADWLYGVTMEEPGISSIVGVRLDEVLSGHSAIDVMV